MKCPVSASTYFASELALATRRAGIHGGGWAANPRYVRIRSIKLATNTRMDGRLKDDMDINCGGILDGTQTLQQTAQEIFENLLRTVSGAKTRSEILGLGDYEFVPWNIGVTG